MLNLRSALRKKLLGFYFSNIDGSYYVRELARRLDVDPTNLSRELNALARQGLLIIETRGNLKYFRLNKHYPTFKELKSIIDKTVGVIGSLKETLGAVPRIQTAILYGSFAKGQEDSASDIDVLLVGDIDAECVADAVTTLEHRLGRDINVTSYHANEFRKKRKDDPFITDILTHRHRILLGSL